MPHYRIQAIQLALTMERPGGRIPGREGRVRFFCDGCHAPLEITPELFRKRITTGLDRAEEPYVPIYCATCAGGKA